MKRLAIWGWLLAWAGCGLGALAAPDPASVPADLKFTQDISARFHVAAWVTLYLRDGSTEQFQYDRYPGDGLHPGVERVKRSEGVFARPPGKGWLRSDDWGATGTPADVSLVPVLDTDVNVVASLFRAPTNRDAAQGGTVWRFVGSAPHGSATDYTFEESREHPKPGAAYPKYTFLKAPGDREGRLFLCGVSANLRDDAGLIPVSVRFAYLVPVPAGTKVQVFDKDTGKEKFNQTVGPDSGFEVTSQTSEPPAAR